MELLWKAVPGLALLLVASAAASRRPPNLRMESVGDTWITLSISQPLADSDRHDVDEYQIHFGSGHNDEVLRTVRNKERDGHPRTEVTLSQLRPGTRYTIRVRAIYFDNSKSPEKVYMQTTSSLSEHDDHTMNYREREMMAAGTSLTYHAFTYVVIGFHVILSWIMAS